MKNNVAAIFEILREDFRVEGWSCGQFTSAIDSPYQYMFEKSRITANGGQLASVYLTDSEAVLYTCGLMYNVIISYDYADPEFVGKMRDVARQYDLHFGKPARS